MKRLILFVLMAFTWLLLTAATGNANDLALQIAGVIIVATPFLLPLLGKFIPLDGKKMLALMYILSVAAALVAGLLAGLFTGLNSSGGIILVGTTEFGLVQLVYQALNQSGAFVVAGKTVEPAKLVN